MTPQRQDDSMSRPAPPPEAVLIRLVREAAGIKTPEAARIAGISKARWSQVELGYEWREGGFRPVRAGAGTLAHMAYAAGVSPERLETEGERPDAAAVLREIERQKGSPDRPRFDDPVMDEFAAKIWQLGRDPLVPEIDDELRRRWIAEGYRKRYPDTASERGSARAAG